MAEDERRRALLDELIAGRRAAGLSQGEVAERMGTSQPAVARLEAGQVDARVSTIQRYADAVGAHLRDPFPPHQPDPWQRPPEPAGPAGWLEERLFDRRVVLLHGPLTGPAATQAAAALLTLDALGPEPVQLHMSVADGELSAAFAVVDAIDAMHAPLHALVTAQAGGAAVAVLAAADRRLAYRHARIRLAEPRAAAVAGTADEVAAAAGQYLRELEELAVRLAEVTGQPRSRVEDDLSAGRILTAEEAREYGLLDDIVGTGS